jgi:hypothetical protein
VSIIAAGKTAHDAQTKFKDHRMLHNPVGDQHYHYNGVGGVYELLDFARDVGGDPISSA